MNMIGVYRKLQEIERDYQSELDIPEPHYRDREILELMEVEINETVPTLQRPGIASGGKNHRDAVALYTKLRSKIDETITTTLPPIIVGYPE